ncbi:MAG: CPBP family intramembrane metalloprotease [Phycisphaerae bacterium]|nr:CPBP family intramembrane metalloprotease [Phycisphaerae bacterium]
MNRHFSPLVKTAWTFIILLTAGVAYLQTLSDDFDEVPDGASEVSQGDPAGLLMARIQAEIALGVVAEGDDDGQLAIIANAINVGTVAQRQSYIAFMIAVGDTAEAQRASLEYLDGLAKEGKVLSSQQAEVQEQLGILMDGGTLPQGHASLEESLGWFGKLLEATPSEKKVMEQKAAGKLKSVGIASGVLIALLILGSIGVIIAMASAFSGKMQNGMQAPDASHGLYAEVFALWLFGFVVLTTGAGIVAQVVFPGDLFTAILCSICAFFVSLLVLFWARIRGISFMQIRKDIGWTEGDGIVKEVMCGIAGYVMTLPFLGIGVLLTLFLFFIQQTLDGGTDSFSGTGGGSHPIILQIAEGGVQIRIAIFILAAIVAPIVEETFFRGVLYRQLRSWSEAWGRVLSTLLSVLIVSFIFAAIHPQGWVAIPALMGIAVGMNLMREWRGTIIPSMIVHGMSNGIVTSILFLVLS